MRHATGVGGREAGLRHAANLASQLSVTLTAADRYNLYSIAQTVAHLLILRLTFYILFHYYVVFTFFGLSLL